MSKQNFFIVEGNAVAKGEVKTLPSGKQIGEVRIAHNERYKDSKTGEWKDGPTSFFNVNSWGNDFAQYSEIEKGTPLLVTGKLQMREYTNKDGVKGLSAEIKAESIYKAPRMPKPVESNTNTATSFNNDNIPFQSLLPHRAIVLTMARLSTRFKNQEVLIKELSSEAPWFGTIRKIFKEADTAFYTVEIESGEEISVAVDSVEWMKPKKKVRVLTLNTLNLQPLRIIEGGDQWHGILESNQASADLESAPLPEDSVAPAAEFKII